MQNTLGGDDDNKEDIEQQVLQLWDRLYVQLAAKVSHRERGLESYKTYFIKGLNKKCKKQGKGMYLALEPLPVCVTVVDNIFLAKEKLIISTTCEQI